MVTFGDRKHWESFVKSPNFKNNQQYWLQEDDYTYFGDIKDASPHGFGRMEYKNGDCYEGQWKGGFMTEGKYEHEGLSFIGTFFALSDCPEMGILSDGETTIVDIKCTEEIEITDPVCWIMLHDLRDGVTGKKYSTKTKKVVSEEEAKEWLMEPRRQEEIKRIAQFKAKYITGLCNEIPVTVSGQPAVIFLCSQSVMGTSTCSEGNSKGKKEFNVMTPVASLPISMQVWVWCKYDLVAEMDGFEKKNVYNNSDRDRNIGELKFEDTTKTGINLKLKLTTLPGVTYINLEFSLDDAGEEDAKLTSGVNSESFSLGQLLATLKTYT